MAELDRSQHIEFAKKLPKMTDMSFNDRIREIKDNLERLDNLHKELHELLKELRKYSK